MGLFQTITLNSIAWHLKFIKHICTTINYTTIGIFTLLLKQCDASCLSTRVKLVSDECLHTNLTIHRTCSPSWRNRLARSAVNRKVGGSSPPGGDDLYCRASVTIINSVDVLYMMYLMLFFIALYPMLPLIYLSY